MNHETMIETLQEHDATLPDTTTLYAAIPVGALTEPVLQAMHIVYEKVGRFEDIRPTIRDSQILARSSRRPTAIVLNKQALR